MDCFDRQRRIAGWDQHRIQEARVLVCGRDWLGTFTFWGLASLGVGEILWVGSPRAATERMARWFLADPAPFSASTIHDYPVEVEYGLELSWVAAGTKLDAVVACADDAVADEACLQCAESTGATWLGGTTRNGGWIGPRPEASVRLEGEHPVIAMVAAAILVDAVRESMTPIRGSSRLEGPLAIDPPGARPSGACVVVGAGGIGVYVATLAAALGVPLRLLDFDVVEASNLNRQGLFTAADARARAHKASAAAQALKGCFPEAAITADVTRVDEHHAPVLRHADIAVLVSAVDNARTRLVLQSRGLAAGLPVVQGGTDVFAADCYTQELDGPLLDDQMHGALSEARGREEYRQPERSGGCAADPSYVVPGMMAAGLVMHRALQVCERYRGLRPIRWRSGDLPVEDRSLAHAFDLGEIAL